MMTKNSRSSRTPMRGPPRKGLLVVGHGDLGGGSPEPVELVEFPDLVQEHVHDHVGVVQQHPATVPDPLYDEGPRPFLAERLLDVAGDGGHLTVRGARADQEIVGEGCAFPDVQGPDADGLLFLRHPGATDQRLPGRDGGHPSPGWVYSRFPAICFSTSGGTSPRML